MIDAYTIGITLALEDGVSDGIAAIRRDLAQLDVAVAESAARLDLLRKLAAETGLSMPPARSSQNDTLPVPRKPGRQAVPPPPDPAEALTAAPTVASPPPPLQPRIAAPKPTSEAPTPITHVAPARPIDALATAPSVPRLAIPAPIVAPAAPPPAAPMPAKKTDGPAPAAPASPRDNVRPIDFAAIARSLSPDIPTSPPPATEAPSPWTVGAPVAPPVISVSIAPPPSPPQAIAAPAPSAPSLPATSLPPAPPPFTVPEAPKAPVSASLVLPPLPRGSSGVSTASEPPYRTPPTTRAVPTAMPPPPRRRSLSEPEAPPNGARPRPRPLAAPVVPRQPDPADNSTDPSQVHRPASAELHLDGTTLGRWVTNYIERQVTRPQSGATGFDPRMTPSWAGAPIGN